nr:protein kinase [Acidobacteriota bacterium]
GLIAVTVIETLTIARAFGLIQIPFIAPWAMAALIISMAVALTNRFNRVYTELDSLNQELESKVADRTVALAETVAQLQEAQVQTERKVQEISQKNQELIASQQQADRIFSALAEALPGTVLDEKYRLEEKIGEGGFGVVFRGTHLSLGRAIAVKVFKPRPGNDNADAVERFKREGISVSRLTHPNVINVLDSGISTQGIAYMVMELLSGKSLEADLKTRTVTTLRHCLEVIIPVCHALAEAHRLGIIHRDIKPDNIFLNQTPEGEVIKVVDFGIAKMVGDEGDENYRKLTMTNSLIGTPVYMSPERVAAKPYDGRSDVYSVGIVLFELLTGRPPFERDLSGLVGLMLAHMNDAPPSICSLNPQIPPIIETIVLKTLEKNPDDRPTAKELAQLLIQALKGIPLAEQNIQFTRLVPESTFDTTQSRVVSDMENAATRGNSLSERPTQIDTPEVTPS